MMLTDLECQGLKIGNKLLFKGGNREFYLEAEIVIVDKLEESLFKATIVKVIHKDGGLGFFSKCVYSQKLAVGAGQLHWLDPVSTRERARHICHLLREVVSGKIVKSLIRSKIKPEILETP